MSTAVNHIPDLWSNEISLSVRAPIVILKVQAESLGRRTQGILKAQVVKSVSEDDRVQLSLDVVAPAIRNIRYRLLTVNHERNTVYPVAVSAGSFFDDPRAGVIDPILYSTDPLVSNSTIIAHTESEFIELIREVLQSREVTSQIQSLIALSNEASRPLVDDSSDMDSDSAS